VRLSETGAALIKKFEGLELTAYRDTGNVLTIGYGHTGADVVENLKITKAKADELFRQDVKKFEDGVLKLVQVPLAQNEFDALVSFSFNLGLGALERSTLLRLLNEGKPKARVAQEIPRWNQDGNGRVLEGLVRRRQAEKDLFLTEPSSLRVEHSIVAKQDTWLKRDPVQSSLLPAEKKLFVPKGAAHVFSEIAILPGKTDYRVTLEFQPTNDWWFFPEHWDIRNTDSASTPAPKPKAVLLPVPYYSQRDNYRDPLRTCFSSSCAMMLKDLKPNSISGDDQYLQTVFSYGDTTDPYTQLKALSYYGVKAEFKQNASWADVDSQLDKGISVPIGILHKGPVSAPSGSGHWIVLIGYTEDKSEYFVHDPYGNLNLTSGEYVSTNGQKLRYSKKGLGPRWLVEGPKSGWCIQAFK